MHQLLLHQKSLTMYCFMKSLGIKSKLHGELTSNTSLKMQPSDSGVENLLSSSPNHLWNSYKGVLVLTYQTLFWMPLQSTHSSSFWSFTTLLPGNSPENCCFSRLSFSALSSLDTSCNPWYWPDDQFDLLFELWFFPCFTQLFWKVHLLAECP